jgi:hypothetical protein
MSGQSGCESLCLHQMWERSKLASRLAYTQVKSVQFGPLLPHLPRWE